MSKIFDLIPKAIEHDGKWFYFSCGTTRAWYATSDGEQLELKRESGLGYDTFMCTDDGLGDLDTAISRLDNMVDEAIEAGRLAL